MVEFQTQADSSGEKGTSPPVCPLLDNIQWEGRQVGAEPSAARQLPLLPTVHQVHPPYLAYHSPAC